MRNSRNDLLSHSVLAVAVILSSVALVGCNNNNNAGGISTPEAFVNKIVELAKNGTIPSGYQNSELAKAQSNQPGYFVIWDAQDQKYMAINLNAYSSGTLDQAVGQFVQTDLQNPSSAGVLVTPDGKSAGGNPLYLGSNGLIYSIDGETKDVDFQRARLQNANLVKTAASISAVLQMSFRSALKVATLSDRLKTMTAQGQQLTPEDRDAVSANLAQIAGLNQQDVNVLLIEGPKGNSVAVDPVLSKIARNLGMPSAATLRDRILAPAGLNVN